MKKLRFDWKVLKGDKKMIIKEFDLKYKIFYIPDVDMKDYKKGTTSNEDYASKDLTFDESFTLVCNGARARASCSNHVTVVPTSTYLNPTSSSMSTMAVPFSGFQLKVDIIRAKLMGVEPMLLNIMRKYFEEKM